MRGNVNIRAITRVHAELRGGHCNLKSDKTNFHIEEDECTLASGGLQQLAVLVKELVLHDERPRIKKEEQLKACICSSPVQLL